MQSVYINASYEEEKNEIQLRNNIHTLHSFLHQLNKKQVEKVDLSQYN